LLLKMPLVSLLGFDIVMSPELLKMPPLKLLMPMLPVF